MTKEELFNKIFSYGITQNSIHLIVEYACNYDYNSFKDMLIDVDYQSLKSNIDLHIFNTTLNFIIRMESSLARQDIYSMIDTIRLRYNLCKFLE